MHGICIAAIMLTLVACASNPAPPAALASAGPSTQDAIALVEHLGETIERAAEASGQPAIRIDLHETAITDDGKRTAGGSPDDQLRRADVSARS